MFKTMICEKISRLLFAALLMIMAVGCGAGSGTTTSSYRTSSGTANTAALSWNSVTTYTDNSAFTAAGYKVYYGKAHNTYTRVVDIPVANLVSRNTPTYTVVNLTRGTYYFVVSVYDASRTESALSTEVSKVIR